MRLKIVSGGQTGVDRAALEVAIERGVAYGGWCPRGGWAEDMPDPPGLVAKYPLLKETPRADTAQRTEWNVRDADATLIVTDENGLAVSKGTALAAQCAEKYGKPLLVIDVADTDAAARAAAWIGAHRGMRNDELTVGIGGPRESEAPGIQAKAKTVIGAILDRICGGGSR